jgi:hypothetical protein
MRRSLILEDVTDEDRKTSKHFIYIVCGYIIREAYSDTCNHVFCKGCYLSKPKQCCPVSGKPITLPIAKPKVDELISVTNIYCTNKACTWTGQIADFIFHVYLGHQNENPITHQTERLLSLTANIKPFNNSYSIMNSKTDEYGNGKESLVTHNATTINGKAKWKVTILSDCGVIGFGVCEEDDDRQRYLCSLMV